MEKFIVMASFGWEGPFLVEAESENEAASNLKNALESLLDESPIAYALARPGNQISDEELNNHFARQGMEGSVKCLSEEPLSVDVCNPGTHWGRQYAVCTFRRKGGLVVESIHPSKSKAMEEKAKLDSESYDLLWAWIQEIKVDTSLAIDEH